MKESHAPQVSFPVALDPSSFPTLALFFLFVPFSGRRGRFRPMAPARSTRAVPSFVCAHRTSHFVAFPAVAFLLFLNLAPSPLVSCAPVHQSGDRRGEGNDAPCMANRKWGNRGWMDGWKRWPISERRGEEFRNLERQGFSRIERTVAFLQISNLTRNWRNLRKFLRWKIGYCTERKYSRKREEEENWYLLDDKEMIGRKEDRFDGMGRWIAPVPFQSSFSIISPLLTETTRRKWCPSHNKPTDARPILFSLELTRYVQRVVT